MDKNVLIWINVPIVHRLNSQSVNLWILRLYIKKASLIGMLFLCPKLFLSFIKEKNHQVRKM